MKFFNKKMNSYKNYQKKKLILQNYGNKINFKQISRNILNNHNVILLYKVNNII